MELSKQPELWVFSNLFSETWVNPADAKQNIFEKQVTIPISLPDGTSIFKIESDGPRGQIISMTIVHGSTIQLFQLTNADQTSYTHFKEKTLGYISEIFPNNFDFYSYKSGYYTYKFREFGLSEILGRDTEIKDLADYGNKSRILQRMFDPIAGYEIPQYWRVLNELNSDPSSAMHDSLRARACDSIAKHAVIEALRCAIIALKHYADLLDRLTSERPQANLFEEHKGLAEDLFSLGQYQDAAVFYSKCLALANPDEQDPLLKGLKASIDRLKPKEFLEYALLAAKIARASHLDK